MTREEAIKIVQSATVWTDEERDALAMLIPELAESEDEKIRKEMIDEIKAILRGEDLGFPPQDVLESRLAYLERQKGYELTEEDKKIIPEALVMLCDDIINHRVHTPIKTDEEGARKIKAFLKTFNRQPYKTREEWEKQKEPQHAIRATKGFGDPDGPQFELVDIQEEQKPAEWSDTDNIGWDEAFACVTQAEKSAKNEEELQNAVTAEKWLKEIKFKYYVHPVKQEWSEEDEKRLKEALEVLNESIKYLPMGHGFVKDVRLVDNWLKSLRPSWKPSEVQMSMLLAVINDPRNAGAESCQLAIRDLYQDLKKL